MTPVRGTMALDVVKAFQRVVLPEARELGDVRRNATLFLAKKAGDRRSSFERDLNPAVNVTRLNEVPYLASLGYVMAAGLLTNESTTRIKLGLDGVTRRAAHTAERTGYADDALCSSGLLLLARAVGDNALAERLQVHLLQSSFSDFGVAALVAVVTSASVRVTVDPSERVVEYLSAALLLDRIDPALVRKCFLHLPVDLEGQLLREVTSPAFQVAADFGGMVVLAALEATLSLPSGDAPPADGPCDVGIVVALREEFRVLFDRLAGQHTHVDDEGRAYYLFDVPTVGGHRPYRCVATMIGDAGTNRAGVVAEKMLGRWDPAVLAIVGIAGGIHGDVRIGDVIIASEVNNYLEGAKAVDDPGGEFRRAGDSFKANYALLQRVRNFEFANQEHFRRWERACKERRTVIGDATGALLRAGLLRDVPALLDGHLASGPLVVTSKEFASWIHAGDRACLAVEMEAAGVMIVAHMDSRRCDALIVRGVSDLGDERKAQLDSIGDGSLRRFAMENATDFLWALMEAGVLPKRP
jgi:nucleoside phosphorylase